MDHFNQLSADEDERLSVLVEEMGETLQCIGKINRHGYESHNPYDPDKTTNRENLERECGDVLYAIHSLYLAGDIREDMVLGYCELKRKKIKQWLHHQDN